ncbi:MAG: glycosyltransferase family 4 protein [Oscillospiraceae bacterium]|jgi:glycosyltransferase involved in cell wall biosynthesis
MNLLYISNASKKVGSFSLSSIQAANACGIECYYASNWSAADAAQIAYDESQHHVWICHVDIERTPYSPKNIGAYRRLVELTRTHKIDVIHCNTPIGGVLGRLVGRKCNIPKVIYQAHGFHFCKGAPLLNWLMYYPVERILARYTDALITINHEDHERAKKFRLRGRGNVFYVPGVGVDWKEYASVEVDAAAKRKELGLDEDDIVLISMGDLIKRKNYQVAIQALAKASHSKLRYLICGAGPEKESLKALASALQVDDRVRFLGFRTDIKELLRISDMFLFTSLQEGLARALMEAMASGLPCVVSKIRGNVDLLRNGQGGFLCDPKDAEGFARCIDTLAENEELRQEMGTHNSNEIRDCFSIDAVEACMEEVYCDVLGVTPGKRAAKNQVVGAVR